MWPNKAEVTGPNGGPIPVMAATVVLPVEDMAPQQREVLRSLLLQAKAKERAKSFDADFVKLARSVYIENDERAAIKRRLNVRLGSSLIEEKSYAEYKS